MSGPDAPGPGAPDPGAPDGAPGADVPAPGDGAGAAPDAVAADAGAADAGAADHVPVAVRPGDPRPDGLHSDPELMIAFTPRTLIVGFAIIAGLIGVALRRRRGRRPRNGDRP